MTELTDRDRREAEEWLMRMLDHPPQDQDGFDAWIAEKPERLAYYKEIGGTVEDACTDAGASGMRPRPAQARKQGSTPTWVQFAWPTNLKPAIAIFCIVLASSVVLVAMLFRGDPMHTAPVANPPSTELATRVGEVRPELLPDGTTATLDTATLLVLRDLGRPGSVELMRGRVRFAVATGSLRRPFVVLAGGNEVVSYGGVLDVSYRDSFTAHVVKGSAEVHLKPTVASSSTGAVVRLQSGQEIVLRDGQSSPPSAIPARPSDEQWIGGVKSLDDVPISEVIAEANTYSDTQIVLADPDLGGRQIFGDINIRDIEAVANAIATYLDLSIDRSQPGRLILTAKK